MKYLLDTCVLSEFAKPSPQASVIRWLSQQDDEALTISVVTAGEIQNGIAQLPEGKRREGLQTWLDEQLLPRFQGRILSVSLEDTLQWGRLRGEQRARGVTLPPTDALLAATAQNHRLILVTRNTKDFAQTQLSLLDPWIDG